MYKEGDILVDWKFTEAVPWLVTFVHRARSSVVSMDGGFECSLANRWYPDYEVVANTHDIEKQPSLGSVPTPFNMRKFFEEVDAPFYGRSQTEEKAAKHKCTCDTFQVVHFGCKCGGV